ncbi:hypothetical protein [Streptomyces phaeolivaceus]|uniref:hypothetical protein n=1 Tax=Streptomyces phaeolivaceus TaxID=2653200 RepID=UPI00299F8701|nr:hypothetical protein [Streptomyces phaeolivaceus]
MHFDRPPQPAPGCADCAELDRLRRNARDVYDHSAVTDANVLLRQHQRAEHRRPEPAPQALSAPEPPPRRKRRHP